MLAIIAAHYATKSGFSYTGGSGLSAGRLFLQTFSVGGFGDDIFILLTGYYLSKKKKSSPAKVLRLAGVTFFYTVLFYLILVLLLGRGAEYDRSLEKLLHIIFPVPFGSYWFITDYLVLYLASPYLNRLLDMLDEVTHRRILLGGICLFSVIPSVLRADFGAAGSWLPWFFVLYLTGAYIRLYADTGKGPFARLSVDRGRLLLLFIGSVLLRVVILAIVDAISPTVTFLIPYEGTLSEIDQFLFFVPALTLFLLFRNMRIRGNAVLYEAAASVFGVYLIHNNEYLKDILWHDIFRCQIMQDSPLLPLHMVGTVIAVFVICVILESLRRYAFRAAGSLILPKQRGRRTGASSFDKK